MRVREWDGSVELRLLLFCVNPPPAVPLFYRTGEGFAHSFVCEQNRYHFFGFAKKCSPVREGVIMRDFVEYVRERTYPFAAVSRLPRSNAHKQVSELYLCSLVLPWQRLSRTRLMLRKMVNHLTISSVLGHRSRWHKTLMRNKR